eukprot:SAG22_NODE_1957_length_3252_cov_3.620044_2_plen_131_part_00
MLVRLPEAASLLLSTRVYRCSREERWSRSALRGAHQWVAIGLDSISIDIYNNLLIIFYHIYVILYELGCRAVTIGTGVPISPVSEGRKTPCIDRGVLTSLKFGGHRGGWGAHTSARSTAPHPNSYNMTYI